MPIAKSVPEQTGALFAIVILFDVGHKLERGFKAFFRGERRGRNAAVVRAVIVRAFLYQIPRHVLRPVSQSVMQRGSAVCVRRVDVCARAHKLFDCVLIAMFVRRYDKRGSAARVLAVDVRAALDKYRLRIKLR